MANIHDNVGELIGKTPLVRVHRLNTGEAEVLVKLESFNPGSSVKDRIALAMIEDGERKGQIKPGTVLIEPTSGNTGIGLALIAAIKGYKLILVMPDTMSSERRKLLLAYGAEIFFTEGAQGMKGAIAKALELHERTPGSFMPQQFENEANPAVHAATTAVEILADTDGALDVFVAGVGTGGTITGVGRALKARLPHVKIVAVEPDTSAVLSGGLPGPHKLQGLGAGFVPKIMDMTVVDEVITITADEAGDTARAVAKQDGIIVGISSGAALAAALKLSHLPAYAGKRIVALLPDSGERYLSTWLFEQP